MEMFQSNIYYHVRIKGYIRLGAKYADVGCMYMETLGCMYAVVECMYMETFGCKVCGCWVQSIWKRLGAKYADVGCKFHNG